MTKKKTSNSKELLHSILEGILEKKGQEVVSLDLSKIDNTVCSNFVICHGDSPTQVKAIADNIELKVKENLNESAGRKQGATNAQWVVLDYFNIIVHIFLEESRELYKLEELWADAEIKKVIDGPNWEKQL